MIYIHLILAFVGSLINYIYFKRIKEPYRRIKLSYAINLFLIFIINVIVIITGNTYILDILEDAIVTLLLATIIGGSIASSARAGINIIPNLGFKIKIERED
jgi:hypothetical protein